MRANATENSRRLTDEYGLWLVRYMRENQARDPVAMVRAAFAAGWLANAAHRKLHVIERAKARELELAKESP